MENKNNVDVLTESVVTYEQFGAVGDAVADDADAIRRAHEYANAHGLKVQGRADARYRIGAVERSSLTIPPCTGRAGCVRFTSSTLHPRLLSRGLRFPRE